MTNKYAHFRTGGLDKGFIEEIKPYQTEQSTLLEKEKEHQEEKEKNFNPADPIHEKINKYLDLPADIMEENKDLYIKTAELNKYFNKGNFFFKGEYEWNQDLKGSEDFLVKKLTSNKNKYRFIIKALEKLGIEDKTKIIPTTKITKTDANNLWGEYKALWRDRGDQPDLTIEYQQTKWICGIYRKLFGSDMISTERVNMGKKKLNKYSINDEILYKQRDLMRYKEPTIPQGDLDFRIGYEHDILRTKLLKKHKRLMTNVRSQIRHVKGDFNKIETNDIDMEDF